MSIKSLLHRGLVFLSVLVMSLFILAACGETTGEPGTEPGFESPGAPTTP